MTNKVEGGCLCGLVRYNFDKDDVISSHHCHCKDCQKSTGSGKATIVLILISNLLLSSVHYVDLLLKGLPHEV